MEYQQFRVLTLDGGGVRGLSSLYILQALMERVNVERYEAGEEPLKPCQLFDLIAGTSTGGLIAIMLGRLGMDVDECIDVYRRLMKKVFDKPKSSMGMSFNAFRTGNIQPKFDSSVLLEQIADVVKQRLGVEDPKKILFNDPDLNNDCHVSYKASQVMGDIRGATIVDAALATSAATGLFDPVNIGGELFADGALLANNPVSEAFEELKNIHRLENNEIEDRICCFVSIGTGDLGLNPLSNRVWEMIRQQLIRVLTETENTMERFREAHRPLFYTGRAFRFNVTHGMEGVALDDWNCADTIKARTGAYLRGHANAIDFNQCAKQLVKPVGSKDQLLFRTRRSYYSIASHWRIILWCLLIPIATFYFVMAKNTRFIESNAPNYNRKAELDVSLPLFAVLGATGVGKSSFIATLGGRHVQTGAPPSIGHRLQSHTEQCEIYLFESLATGPGYLIDTPGIDESNRTRTDTEIMNLIQNELERVQIYDKMLTGLIYLYDIRQPRVYGSTLNALDTTINMLEYLLGTNGVAKITLVTTKWTKDASEDVKKKEEQNERTLQDDYWKGPMRCGSTLERYDGTKASGIDILANLRNRKRRMYPEPSRCKMSIQTPTSEPVLEPEPSQPSSTKVIPDLMSWIFYLPGEHSETLDATANILVPPPWLWTPAWVVIATLFRVYLTMIIEERLRAANVIRLARYPLVIYVFYILTVFQKPAGQAFWVWHIGRVLLTGLLSHITCITWAEDGDEGYTIIATMLTTSGFFYVPGWVPIWPTYILEGLRFVLLLFTSLLPLMIIGQRQDNRTGGPRKSLTQYRGVVASD